MLASAHFMYTEGGRQLSKVAQESWLLAWRRAVLLVLADESDSPISEATAVMMRRLQHGEHERYYANEVVYEMRWSLEAPLTEHMASGAAHGGPIALLRDGGVTAGARLLVFNAAGAALGAWDWQYGRVLTIGWTSELQLVTVLETARVMVWSMQGERLASFALSAECEQQGLLHCALWPGGLLAITQAYRVVALLGWEERRVLKLAQPMLGSPPTTFAVLPPAPAAGRAQPEALIATASRTILLVTEAEVADQLLSTGPFTRIVPAPNGKFIAAFSAAGSLFVYTKDFSRHLSEFVTKMPRAPRELVWCGVDSLVLHWEALLLMVGPFGDWIKCAPRPRPRSRPRPRHAACDAISRWR